MAMGDRIVVMSAAVVQQVGTPAQVYHDPANLFVANFIGSPGMNLVTGKYADGVVNLVGGSVYAVPEAWKPALATTLREDDVVVGFRPEAAQVSEMRQTQQFLRSQLASQYPLRARKVVEYPLLFAGSVDEIRYAAALPSRVAAGGLYYFRLTVVRDGDKSRLVQERVIADPDAIGDIDFRDAERAVLAEGIDELKIGYFGRDRGAADADVATWRDRWDDKQRLPLLVRIDVKPQKGPPWPQLIVETMHAPEVGCRNWDLVNSRCTAVA
jgi:hypothetical protein